MSLRRREGRREAGGGDIPDGAQLFIQN